MDEKTAWNTFCMTGKVEDYIRYSRIRDAQAAVKPEMPPADKVSYADKHRWNNHKGAGSRRE